MGQPTPQSDRLIRIFELCNYRGHKGIVPVSKATLYRWIRENSFPAPLRLGKHSVAWRWADVAAWLESNNGGAL